ncbi:MAG: InlB B-repeat-containing protein [Clostridia bacterium]|nr:InlB B-repeat-containing protein [Clostridia bacterium]
MNKKLIALILCIFCLASIFALTSCGDNGDTDTDTSAEPTEITIYLDVKGGQMNFSYEFEWTANEDIEYLPTPTKDGYEFLGWSLNGEIVTLPFSASEDILLVAEWSEQASTDTDTETNTDTETDTETDDPNLPYFTVTFDPKDGAFSGELTIQVQEGNKIPQPANPVAEGKIFSGWYSGTASSSRWDFETMVVTGDVTLTAWYQGGTSCAHEETVPVPEKSYPATCEKGGKEYVRCTKCGLTTFTNIEKLGHDLVTEVIPETCATDGYTHVYCQREGCDEDRIHSIVYATGNHTYGSSFVTLVPPTQYVGGEEAKVCTVCGGTQKFKIPSIAEMDGLLWDLDIGNYTYTGGKYVDASFVDIAKNAGLSASSYYTVCLAKNAIDGGGNTFWCADTLADGAKFTGDELIMTFAQAYDVGMIKLTVPHYYAWDLGEDCYVSYDLEAMIDGEWQLVGILSDKNAIPAGTAGAIIYELDSPIYTDQLRFTVSHSTRNTPAMIYEIEVMAAVEETERVSQDLINSSSLSSSGKYNSWATGTETLMDGSYDTFWNSNYKDRATVGEIFTAITFPEDKFVTAVQFAVAPNVNKQFSVYYLDSDGETWLKACTYNVVKSSSITIKGDSNGDGEADGSIIEVGKDDNGNVKQRVLFTCDIAKFTSGIKLVIDSDGDQWAAYVYEFIPYTAVEQGADLGKYGGCAHNSFKISETVAPSCTTAGYSIMECYGCDFKCTTDAVDAYGHIWSEYIVATAAEGTNAGTKESVCLKDGCNATRTTNYYNDYEDPKITTYRGNAPAAWAQTLDDGNYLATYEWIIPKLQERGWKATAVLSVCYVDMYVNEWNEYFASGALDLGSHSYTHGGYYSGQISENSLLSDVVNAHYWFMSKFSGQRILGFATPNGQTSTGTSEYVTGVMASARNGGNSKYFYNVIEELAGNGYGQSPLVGSITVDEETGEVIFTQSTNKAGELSWVSTRRAWGNMNSYISKSDQTEGAYIFVKADGTIGNTSYKKITQKAVIDETTGEQAVDENGNLVWENLSTPIYEPTNGGYDLNNGVYTFNENGGTHVLIETLSGEYHYVAKADAKLNYVYDEDANRLVDKGRTQGTYKHFTTYKEDGTLWDAYHEWVEVGSYDFDGTSFTFRNDNNGEYKLHHVALGSYEKGINEILSVGGMTVECLHEIGKSSAIWSSYASTNSKFQYLDQTGVWVCSYTELIQYMKEQLSATLTMLERTDSKIRLSLTDTLDDYMYNLPLTIQVDIDDSWVDYGIKATQNGKELEFFVENGYVYVDAVPDAGEILITPAILCADGTINHEFDWDVTDEASCTETGLKNGACTRCEYSVTDVVIPATGHTFNEDAWTQISEADCTNPTKFENFCTVCGQKDYKVTQEAFGHTLGDWTATIVDGVATGTAICSVCNQEVTASFTNITKDSFKAPVATGAAWGSDTGALVNGNYTDTPIAPKDTGEFSVTMEAGVATYVDAFAVTGFGFSEYYVTVYYENGDTAVLGSGNFGENGTETTVFSVKATVTKFVVTMEKPSNGSDKWSELSVFVTSND